MPGSWRCPERQLLVSAWIWELGAQSLSSNSEGGGGRAGLDQTQQWPQRRKRAKCGGAAPMGERRGWGPQEAAAGRQAPRGVWEAQGRGWSDPGGAVAEQELCRMDSREVGARTGAWERRGGKVRQPGRSASLKRGDQVQSRASCGQVLESPGLPLPPQRYGQAWFPAWQGRLFLPSQLWRE